MTATATAPISESRLAANRANAQHSTGPRTEEGKSRTRLNNLRHGLTGQTVFLPHEDRVAYDSHHTQFLAELTPKGVIETQLAHHIADDYWRLNRIKAIENNIFALGIEAHAGEFRDDPEGDAALGQAQTYLDQARELNLLSLYEQRIKRSILNQTKELERLQRVRYNAEEYSRAARASEKSGGVEEWGGFGFSNSVTPAVAAAGSSSPTSETPPQNTQKAA